MRHMGEVAESSAFQLREHDVDPAATRGLPGLRALEVAAAELAQLHAIDRLAAVVGTAARDGLSAGVLVVAIFAQDGRHLRGAYVGGVRSAARRRLLAIPLDGPSLLAQVARTGRPVYQSSARHGVSVLRSTADSVAMLPLPAAAGAVGVLVLGRSGDRGFSADDMAFLNVLAALSAPAVERAGRQLALRAADTQLRVGRLRIDLEHLQVEIDGRSAHLTPTEMRLLIFLAEEPGRPRTRAQILGHLWQTDYVGGERACDAHIWNLRRKIERVPTRPELLVTRRGVGYALEVA
jgi:Transcriptional regulatory protein, C terminal/GAF domain